MSSWRFKNRKNKIGTVIGYIGAIGIILIITAGFFMLHWAFGVFIIFGWLLLIGLLLTE